MPFFSLVDHPCHSLSKLVDVPLLPAHTLWRPEGWWRPGRSCQHSTLPPPHAQQTCTCWPLSGMLSCPVLSPCHHRLPPGPRDSLVQFYCLLLPNMLCVYLLTWIKCRSSHLHLLLTYLGYCLLPPRASSHHGAGSVSIVLPHILPVPTMMPSACVLTT